MAHVIFYEKPGCGGNARQKALLTRSGHQLEVRDLLSTPWQAGSLRAFFGARPVSQWFNAASPRIKSGEVRPDSLSETEALALMLADPLLIRRPLMEVEGRREAGFEAPLIEAWIGLAADAPAASEACPRATSDSPPRCAKPDKGT